ncbi:MAG: hypothetical protein VKJ05_02345 [Synechococcaceae cyanobacterium]|nr:hypothetical protein [Synechococcaceae cyanobacterium]
METTPSVTEFALSTNTVLAVIATSLLVFVSGGVVYLSSVEWRDKRRRRAQEGRSR